MYMYKLNFIVDFQHFGWLEKTLTTFKSKVACDLEIPGVKPIDVGEESRGSWKWSLVLRGGSRKSRKRGPKKLMMLFYIILGAFVTPT